MLQKHQILKEFLRISGISSCVIIALYLLGVGGDPMVYCIDTGNGDNPNPSGNVIPDNASISYSLTDQDRVERIIKELASLDPVRDRIRISQLQNLLENYQHSVSPLAVYLILSLAVVVVIYNVPFLMQGLFNYLQAANFNVFIQRNMELVLQDPRYQDLVYDLLFPTEVAPAA